MAEEIWLYDGKGFLDPGFSDLSSTKRSFFITTKYVTDQATVSQVPCWKEIPVLYARLLVHFYQYQTIAGALALKLRSRKFFKEGGGGTLCDCIEPISLMYINAWMVYSLVVRARGLEYGGREFESRSLHLKPETKLREERGLSGCRKGLKTVPLAQALLILKPAQTLTRK